MSSSIYTKRKVSRIYTGPKIIVDQSRNLPVPIKVSLIYPKSRISSIRKPTEVNFLRTVRFGSKHAVPQPPMRKFRTPICRWFRRKRALNQLINEHKKERKAIERRKQAQFEQERLKDFIRWENLKPKISPTEQKHKPLFQKSYKSPKIEKPKYIKPTPAKVEPKRHKDLINWEIFKPKKAQVIEKPIYEVNKQVKYTPEPVKYITSDPPKKYMTSPVVEKQPNFYYQPQIYDTPYKYETIPKIEKKYKGPVIVARECRGVCINEKPAKVKPAKKSKSVSVKKYNHRETITNKFVNCFYRVCCQFYCYLTCIIIITCIVLCLI